MHLYLTSKLWAYMDFHGQHLFSRKTGSREAAMGGDAAEAKEILACFGPGQLS